MTQETTPENSAAVAHRVAEDTLKRAVAAATWAQPIPPGTTWTARGRVDVDDGTAYRVEITVKEIAREANSER